ncbi:hypothetical protein [Virgibacillus sp. YIM 98842]|uniref:hypothetical protein n=1 Tax=Virgibacillus sp. YIM 98842 TaxID=2663533 RepID=UPI0013D9C36F|nr:hypothetical protein [Virgibacillus sp. YIM 98842]
MPDGKEARITMKQHQIMNISLLPQILVLTKKNDEKEEQVPGRYPETQQVS